MHCKSIDAPRNLIASLFSPIPPRPQGRFDRTRNVAQWHSGPAHQQKRVPSENLGATGAQNPFFIAPFRDVQVGKDIRISGLLAEACGSRNLNGSYNRQCLCGVAGSHSSPIITQTLRGDRHYKSPNLPRSYNCGRDCSICFLISSARRQSL